MYVRYVRGTVTIVYHSFEYTIQKLTHSQRQERCGSHNLSVAVVVAVVVASSVTVVVAVVVASGRV